MTSSVVIVCHRPGDWLAECVASVIDQADDVIVVDNGSKEKEASRIATQLGARPIHVPTNVGFAAGVNLGVRHARSDLIGLLNDDAAAGSGWLASARRLLEDQEVAAVTPKVLLATAFAEVPIQSAPAEVRLTDRDVTGRCFTNSGRVYVPLLDEDAVEVLIDGTPVPPIGTVRLLNHAGMYLHRNGFAGDYGLGAPDDGRFDQPAERFGCSGAAPVFRAETLARLGGFEERFFAYNEDVDWCFRARLSGMRFLYDPTATVNHRMWATSGGNQNPATQLLTRRNQLLTLVRNAPMRVAAEHLSRAALSPHRRGVRQAVAKLLPWAVASRSELRRQWVRTPEDVWRDWVGVDNRWDPPLPVGAG